MYKIELSRTAAKEMEKVYNSSKQLYKRIISSLETLCLEPYSGKALKGTLSDCFSYRIGSYRIIYSVFKKKLLVTVIDIGHRREIYR